MKKKKRFSILRCFVSIICVLFIVVSVGINIIYSQTNTPNFFGRYLYTITERDTNGIDVTQGATIIAMEASGISIAQKDLVLCCPSGDENDLRLCGIFDIIQTEDGTEKYQIYYDGHEDNENLITKEDIKAVCTGYPQSMELGSFIAFTRKVPGIVAELIIPCIILLVFFISRLSAKEEEEAEAKAEEENADFSDKNKNTQSQSVKKTDGKNVTPLFEPTQASDELERKKMSIAENFSQKKVNPDSPYQKEKTRTMQFKAANRTNVAKIRGSVSPAPNADDIREDIRRKNEYEVSHIKKSEDINSFSENTAKPLKPVRLEEFADDNTVIISASQVAEKANNPEIKRNTISEIKESYISQKSSSPDISDILSRSEVSRRKRNASDMSVDDLLKIIEEEKKKL